MQSSASPEVDAVFSTEQSSSSSSSSTTSSWSPSTSQASPDVQQYTLKFPTSHLTIIKTHQLQHVIQSKVSPFSSTSPSSHAHLIALTADATLRQAVDTMKSLDLFALPLIEPVDHTNKANHQHSSSSSKSKHHSIHDRIIGIINCYHLAAPILRHKIFDELLASGDDNEWQSLNNAHLPEWDLVVRTLTAVNASSSSPTTTTTSSTRNSSSNMHSSTAAVWLKADASLSDLFALFGQGAQYCLVAAANGSTKPSPSSSSSSTTSSSSSSSPSGSVTVSEVEFVSVTDLLRWVQANQDKFCDILSLTVEEAGLVASIDGMRTAKTWPSALSGDGDDDSKFARVEFRARKNAGRIMSVKENTPTISAFRMMLSGDRDAVAIVDDSGKLTATLAVSDFRFVDSEQLSLLSQPVDTFVKFARAQSSSSSPSKNSPTTCSVDATLKQLLQLDHNDTTNTPFQHSTQDHPIWVVNKQGAPVAAVTLSDIVFALSQHQP